MRRGGGVGRYGMVEKVRDVLRCVKVIALGVRVRGIEVRWIEGPGGRGGGTGEEEPNFVFRLGRGIAFKQFEALREISKRA